MTTDDASVSGLSPDAAFSTLGDETRLEILRTLSEVGEPLAFSTLFERSEYDTRSNFSYHLDRLEGHFISRTDEGYALRQAGRRVVEAFIAGTVTADPIVERAPTDRSCPFCAAPIEVSYHQERVEMYCSECTGVVRPEGSGEQYANEFGTLGAISLPPAGVEGRTPAAMFEAAKAWSNIDLLAASAGICSRCAGVVEHSMSVCADHDVSAGVCEHCDRRYAVLFEVACSHCHFDRHGIALVCLLGRTELLSFLTDHGANPLLPETHDVARGALANYEEEIRSHDPFEVALSFTIRDETLTLTIDEDAEIVAATRERTSGSD